MNLTELTLGGTPGRLSHISDCDGTRYSSMLEAFGKTSSGREDRAIRVEMTDLWPG